MIYKIQRFISHIIYIEDDYDFILLKTEENVDWASFLTRCLRRNPIIKIKVK